MKKRHSLFDLRIGTVIESRIGHSEDSKDKRLYCDIVLDDGIQRKNLPYYGGGVDVNGTGKPHGIFIPPLDGQMVGVFFVQGHFKNPTVCFPIPMPWDRSNMEKYYDLLENKDDIIIYHKTGSSVRIKTDGSIHSNVNIEDNEKSRIVQNADGSIQSVVDIDGDEKSRIVQDIDGNVEIQQKSGKDITINGDSKNFVTHAELNTALQSFVGAVNGHIHITTATVGATPTPGVIAPLTPALTLDISSSKTNNVKTG